MIKSLLRTVKLGKDSIKLGRDSLVVLSIKTRIGRELRIDNLLYYLIKINAIKSVMMTILALGNRQGIYLSIRGRNPDLRAVVRSLLQALPISEVKVIAMRPTKEHFFLPIGGLPIRIAKDTVILKNRNTNRSSVFIRLEATEGHLTETNALWSITNLLPSRVGFIYNLAIARLTALFNVLTRGRVAYMAVLSLTTNAEDLGWGLSGLSRHARLIAEEANRVCSGMKARLLNNLELREIIWRLLMRLPPISALTIDKIPYFMHLVDLTEDIGCSISLDELKEEIWSAWSAAGHHFRKEVISAFFGVSKSEKARLVKSLINFIVDRGAIVTIFDSNGTYANLNGPFRTLRPEIGDIRFGFLDFDEDEPTSWVEGLLHLLLTDQLNRSVVSESVASWLLRAFLRDAQQRRMKPALSSFISYISLAVSQSLAPSGRFSIWHANILWPLITSLTGLASGPLSHVFDAEWDVGIDTLVNECTIIDLSSLRQPLLKVAIIWAILHKLSLYGTKDSRSTTTHIITIDDSQGSLLTSFSHPLEILGLLVRKARDSGFYVWVVERDPSFFPQNLLTDLCPIVVFQLANQNGAKIIGGLLGLSETEISKLLGLPPWEALVSAPSLGFPVKLKLRASDFYSY